jgi:hypothetical protein
MGIQKMARFKKNHLGDKEIEIFVDWRFFAGGKYLVNTSAKGKGTADLVLNEKTKVELQVAVGPR